MEKFAVDLDKVLDDFELNEDRAERFAAKNKTPPKLQQPLLNRASGRVGSKRECYSRPELPERLRRINLVDADFAPNPNSISTPRIPNSIHDGTGDLQGSKNGNISLQVGQLQHNSESWLQHELNLQESLSTDVVVQSKDEIVSEAPSDQSASATVILSSFSSFSDGGRKENVYAADEKLVVNDGTLAVGLGNSISGTSPCTDEQVGVISLESDVGEEEPASPNTIILPKSNVENLRNKNEASPPLVDHSSESVLVFTSVPSEETTKVDEESSSTANDRNSLEPSKLVSHDRPLELSYENGNSKNVPLDSLETRHVGLSSEETTSGGNRVSLDVLSGETSLVSGVSIEETVKPVSFQLEEEMSDSEMNKFLDELEDEAGGNEEVIPTENDREEVINNIQEVVGIAEKVNEAFESREMEKEELEDKERPLVEGKMLTSQTYSGSVAEEKISTEMEVPEKQTVCVDSKAEEQCVKLEYKSGGGDKSDPECTKEGVASVELKSPCQTHLVGERMLGEGAAGGEEEHVEGAGRGEGGMEKLLTGEGRKAVIDCRVESWVVEGNGKLLEGASINERTSAASLDSESISSSKQGNRSVLPVRPDSLSIGGVVASAGTSSVDEEDPIPMPFIIGPPGATPANPRPPSEIASAITVSEYSAKQETERQADTTETQEQASHQVGSTHIESVGLSEGVDVVGSVAANERLEQSPVSSTEDSSPSLHDGEDVKQVMDERGEVPESCDDSSPDSGDRNSLPGDVPSNAGLGVQNVTVEGAADCRPDFQLPLLAGSGLGVSGDETGCSTLALGDVAPFWVPDGDAPSCMSCAAKFTLIKRRHHCRACGKVLCSKCCSSRARLAYMDHSEARVCMPCHSILQEAAAASGGHSPTGAGRYQPSRGLTEGEGASSEHSPRRRHGFGRPDPNNPMEYCSTVPPLEQVGERARAPPPTVMVPVGVLKREGSTRSKGEAKQVMFSDGIRPGGELSDLDRSPTALSGSAKCQGLSAVQRKIASRLGKRLPGVVPPGPGIRGPISQLPTVASRIPDDALPPMVDKSTGGCVGGGAKSRSTEYNFEEGPDLDRLMETLRDESEPPVAFALSKNFFVLVKIITLDCCVNRVVWSFTTRGMRCVGQDEVIVLLEWLPSDKGPPRDIFCHLGALYEQAAKGNTVTELGHSTVQGLFLGSHNHGGFLYIRATFQCLRRLPLPPPPFLFGLLLHRMETPWAKVFPIRVMLRLGAEFRYYPCPLVGIRGREPVYQQIGHTIMNLLSDFRNFAYVLPSVRGMVIHMEERQTSILLPKNRLSQVERALEDSDDHVLALAASFSSTADSHLVCVQGESGDASTGSNHYHTQAINIQNKPRKVTGASFVVFNGALKASAKLTAKSSIVEDGLMVQILPDTLTTLRNALRNAEDFVIPCGPVTPVIPSAQQTNVGDNESSTTAPSQPVPDEVVIIRWVDDDKNFNIGVKSPIDGMALDGVPSIRVHNGTNYVSDTKFIRWTEVFLIQCAEAPGGRSDTMDVSRISESIAHAACLALHPYLDLLWSHALTLIAVRATVGPDSEGYEAGCGGTKLPPIYMNGLDNELVGVLHKIEVRPRDGNLVLELLFHLMEL